MLSKQIETPFPLYLHPILYLSHIATPVAEIMRRFKKLAKNI